MKKDKHVNKFTEQSSNDQSDAERTTKSSCFSAAYLSHVTDRVTEQAADSHTVDQPSQLDKAPFLVCRSQSSSSDQQSNHQSGSPELCEKIRSSLGHFTEEFKEKFIKKKNRSPNLFANRRNEDRSNNSSDQEENETRPQVRSITRIKINANEENDFSSPNLSQQNNFGHSPSPSYQNSQSASLSQCNQQCNSISQNSLFESARSPFVNRALPPLPKKQQDDAQAFSQPFTRSYSNLKTPNSRSDGEFDRNQQQRNENSSDERPFSKSNPQKFNPKKSSEKAAKSSHSTCSNHSTRFSPDSDPEEDDEQILTNCFKFNRENRDQLKKCSAKIKNEIKHFLPKKFAHPPPHLHSKKKVVQLFDYDDEEEEEDYEETTGGNLGQPASRSSETNLNGALHGTGGKSSNAQHSSGTFSSPSNADQPLNESSPNQLNDETRKMMDYAESIEKVKGKTLFG